jgi:hypothetical protein
MPAHRLHYVLDVDRLRLVPVTVASSSGLSNLLSSTALPPTVVVVVAETSDKEEASPSRA